MDNDERELIIAIVVMVAMFCIALITCAVIDSNSRVEAIRELNNITIKDEMR